MRTLYTQKINPERRKFQEVSSLLRSLLKFFIISYSKKMKEKLLILPIKIICVYWLIWLPNIISLTAMTTWCTVCWVLGLTRKHIHLRNSKFYTGRVIISLMILLELSTLKALISTWLEGTKISLEIHHWCQGIGWLAAAIGMIRGLSSLVNLVNLVNLVASEESFATASFVFAPRGHWLIWRT